jgi:hypothetical protein
MMPLSSSGWRKMQFSALYLRNLSVVRSEETYQFS